MCTTVGYRSNSNWRPTEVERDAIVRIVGEYEAVFNEKFDVVVRSVVDKHLTSFLAVFKSCDLVAVRKAVETGFDLKTRSMTACYYYTGYTHCTLASGEWFNMSRTGASASFSSMYPFPMSSSSM